MSPAKAGLLFFRVAHFNLLALRAVYLSSDHLISRMPP
jgi:hypothetical protein